MPIPTTTSITADPAEADVGEKISFTGLVKAVDGEPVRNGTVYIETAINRKIWTLLSRRGVAVDHAQSRLASQALLSRAIISTCRSRSLTKKGWLSTCMIGKNE